MSSHIDQKADRLRSDGRVKIIINGVDAFVASVQGDHATYGVFIDLENRHSICNCPARGDCSHQVAVLRQLLEEAS